MGVNVGYNISWESINFEEMNFQDLYDLASSKRFIT